MKKKYKVTYDREGCIGAASCIVFSKRFKMAKDGKVDFIGAKEQDEDFFVLEIDEHEFKEILESARSCPVNVIHIHDLEIKKKII